ncbi:hypothetical protein N7462_003898 [Penicillium macrosclerotiorum]|uniref:uncharacterized protein n=1 Tax=Penicillium macrosclerotiorum TaxID=303699 RepID=UPI002546F268|nr:uncharacterized protein N7462_003898 [Penicillium macrosclerotiorum]KAJ5689506.1 hypothetical protein N7462_003898 [Penicillium macrosclerotiorum]
MANHPPPPLGGHSNYTQQWAPAFPSMIPPNYHPNPENTSTIPPPPVASQQHFEFNMNAIDANSQVPVAGATGGPGVFFPSQFPYMAPFDPSQLSNPSFPPIPLPSFGYPPIPIPPGFSNIPPGPLNAYSANVNRPLPTQPKIADASSSADSNLEEGEVNQKDSQTSARSKKDARIASRHISAAQRSDLEEGETISSPSPSSSRSSSRTNPSFVYFFFKHANTGLAYNPPLSVSPDPEVVNRAIERQNRDARTVASEYSQPARSATQLRVQAQGALLRLAPHNIRFDDLVAEGINPAILRQLYEDVGIRVGTPTAEKPPVHPKLVGTDKNVQSSTTSSRQSKTTKPVAPEKTNIAPKPPLLTPQPPATAVTTGSEKPIERKELIARMLAAKAAKASQPSLPKEPSKEKQSPLVTPAVTPSIKENGTGMPTREKNKAQTELARQRIEELKKQALLKSQQKAQQLSQPAQDDQALALPTPPAPVVQHPLPVRPPIPQAAEPSGIPGLFMTDSKPDVESQGSTAGTPGISVDPTPVSRATQRKRPRACDFDEPATASKKHSSHAIGHYSKSEKLIIDISDDESLYGDDEGENMDVDASPERDSLPTTVTSALDTARPPLQKYPSATRTSTSTPQGSARPSDQENIRQRDLEIQALHRKIAEMEERRKAKLAASRTQSPRNLEDSGVSSSATQSSAAEADVAETPSAPVTVADKFPTSTGFAVNNEVPQQNPMDFFSDSSVVVLASMTSTQLGSLVSTIFRLKAAETSIPPSDNEQTNTDSLNHPLPERPAPATEDIAMDDTIHSPDHEHDMSDHESDEDSEAYEPPEPDAGAESDNSAYSPPFSPAPAAPIEDEAGLEPLLDLSQPNDPPAGPPQISTLEARPLYLGSEAEILGKTSASTKLDNKYSPYVSPLRYFKAYRYHPGYTEDVSDGYRSLTFSHDIDSMKYFCPYELAGGILIQMGAVREGQTEEEKETYLAGLKEIINEMRRDKVKDFSTVAAEIAAYRRRFLQDPSRVLPL